MVTTILSFNLKHPQWQSMIALMIHLVSLNLIRPETDLLQQESGNIYRPAINEWEKEIKRDFGTTA